MLQGDNSECAKAINKMLAAKRPPAFEVEGLTKFFPDVGMFGHYDSRGGCTMVVNSPSVLHACIQYNRMSYWPDLATVALDDLLVPGGSDIYFVGREPKHSEDLDQMYAGEGAFLYARVQTRYRTGGDNLSEWSEWSDTNAWVFWLAPEMSDEDNDVWNTAAQDSDSTDEAKVAALAVGQPPKIDLASPFGKKHNEVRLRPDSLGEDAMGVWFFDTLQAADDVKVQNPINLEVEW